MYGIDKDFDFSFLIGMELVTVSFGVHDLVFGFGVNTIISICSNISYTDNKGVCTLYDEDLKLSAVNLVALLGQKIERAKAISEKALCLTFSNNAVVKIYDDSEIYESFFIQKGNKTLVVV